MVRWLANTPLELEQKALFCYLLTSCSSEFVEFLNRLFIPLHPVYLLDFSNLLVASLVVPTLAPDIDMPVPIARMPLDLFDLLI